ncbi:MAG: hypothetical protein IJR58_08425 [Lachnospiraceae bacterium]|nr:hypothetical protein [Lachnospiraceae bacterium]
MHYNIVVFGVKDASENVIKYIHNDLMKVDLVVTIAPDVTKKNQVAGYKGLSSLKDDPGIEVYEAKRYPLDDADTQAFFRDNSFDLGIVMGWQRLIPAQVLERFSKGVFGFHGNAGYLPFGRGRSPLNWSILLGDSRFNLNLFRYDEQADSPNVFETTMFSITPHDDIRTASYKNLIASKRMIKDLIEAYKTGGDIPIRTESKDFDSWYDKRTPKDGKIDFTKRTREIYNLIRAVASPFPGAFCFADETRVTIWQAQPFDEMLDFREYAPGEIIDIMDERLIVRTVDASLLITKYESEVPLKKGMVLT